MASKHQKIFEELGLLEEKEFTNPFKTLGIDGELANGLLQEDHSGEALRTVSMALFRVLSQRYHPDKPKTGDSDRFTALREASVQIADAPRDALIRWSKTEGVVSNARTQKLQKDQAELLEHSAQMFSTSIAFGNHPLHFTEFVTSQGLLVERSSSNLLIQPNDDTGGLTVLPGTRLPTQPLSEEESTKFTRAFNFHKFLQANDLFGLEPGRNIAAYIDHFGRASILASDLSFLMDITDPITSYRRDRKKYSVEDINRIGERDLWVRMADPVLHITKAPNLRGREYPDATTLLFQRKEAENHGQPIGWQLPQEMAGSIADESLFNRMRHVKHTGRMAITAAKNGSTNQYFTLQAVPSEKLIEENVGYSPLLEAGNGLMLYDASTTTPIVTNAKIVGLLGSNASAK